MNRIEKLLTALPLIFGAVLSVCADDAAANEKIKEAAADEASKSYYSAAKNYLKAETEAENQTLKANSLLKAAENFRRCGLIYREYEAISTLLAQHGASVDSASLIDRVYSIGDEFYGGKREPSFWALRFIPWMTDPDRTVEVYTRAVELAPFSPRASGARLRLAMRLLDENKGDKAIEQMQLLQSGYPDSREHKYSYLMLGEIFYNKALRGDGDGEYARKSLAQFREFRTKYPNSPELAWVHKMELRLKDVQAERLLETAGYYRKIGRNDAAGRYLSEVIQTYPDSVSAAKSETMLTEIDRTYLPSRLTPEVEKREMEYAAYEIPEEPKKLLIIPENSNGKYLLPIYDLKGGAIRVDKVNK